MCIYANFPEKLSEQTLLYAGTDFQTTCQIWEKMREEGFLVAQQTSNVNLEDSLKLLASTSRKHTKKLPKRGRMEVIANEYVEPSIRLRAKLTIVCRDAKQRRLMKTKYFTPKGGEEHSLLLHLGLVDTDSMSAVSA